MTTVILIFNIMNRFVKYIQFRCKMETGVRYDGFGHNSLMWENFYIARYNAALQGVLCYVDEFVM